MFNKRELGWIEAMFNQKLEQVDILLERKVPKISKNDRMDFLKTKAEIGRILEKVRKM